MDKKFNRCLVTPIFCFSKKIEQGKSRRGDQEKKDTRSRTTSPAVVIASAFSGDGKRLVTLTEKAARVWDAGTGEPLGPVIPIDSDFDLKPRVQISNDGMRIAVHYSYAVDRNRPVPVRRPQSAIVWQCTGERLISLRSKIESGPRVFGPAQDDGAVIESAMSPDGKFLVAGRSRIGDGGTVIRVGRADNVFRRLEQVCCRSGARLGLGGRKCRRPKQRQCPLLQHHPCAGDNVAIDHAASHQRSDRR